MCLSTLLWVEALASRPVACSGSCCDEVQRCRLRHAHPPQQLPRHPHPHPPQHEPQVHSPVPHLLVLTLAPVQRPWHQMCAAGCGGRLAKKTQVWRSKSESRHFRGFGARAALDQPSFCSATLSSHPPCSCAPGRARARHGLEPTQRRVVLRGTQALPVLPASRAMHLIRALTVRPVCPVQVRAWALLFLPVYQPCCCWEWAS